MSELTDLQERLELYKAGEKAILEGNQSWNSPDGMVYNRGNLFHLQREIRNIRQEISMLDGSGSYDAQVFTFGGRR